ncbi:MAG: HlyD family secretion protein [Betaproteobacteria bacterium]
MNFFSKLSAFQRKMLLLAAAILVLAAGAIYWFVSQGQRSTDDAYVGAKVAQVSSLVMGPITNVVARNNQYVKKGDLLFEIDPRPFQVALTQAEAKLKQAQKGARQDFSELHATEADVSRQRAELANAQSNLDRTRSLITRNFVSAQAEDDAQAKVSTSVAALAEATARAEKARTVLVGSGELTPEMKLAIAEMDKAKLDLEHATVRASEDGWITNFNLAAGTVVTPGSPLFALIVDKSFWVDANFKETELQGIRPGQKSTIVVDMYPDRKFTGEVESLAGGTGTAFSLLPPQNASGNWVKVTQRVPVRMHIVDSDPAFPLRVGATATVTIKLK